MHNLPHRPSAVAIRRFDLFRIEILNRRAQCRRCLLDVLDELVSLGFGSRAFELEFSNGITGIAMFTSELDYRLRYRANVAEVALGVAATSR